MGAAQIHEKAFQGAAENMGAQSLIWSQGPIGIWISACSPVTRKVQFPTALPLQVGTGSDHCPRAVHSVLGEPSRANPSGHWKWQREPEVSSAGARSQLTEPSAGRGTASQRTAAAQGAHSHQHRRSRTAPGRAGSPQGSAEREKEITCTRWLLPVPGPRRAALQGSWSCQGKSFLAGELTGGSPGELHGGMGAVHSPVDRHFQGRTGHS